MTACARKKVLLMILDGWGIGRGDRADVIGSVRPQRLGEFAAKYPHAELRTDGENVGLPDGQMGNSEVGHLNIGAGRVLYQDLVKINRAVADGSIGDNPEVKDYHKKTGTTVLLVSHSMEDIAKYADKVLVMNRKKIAMYDTVEKVFARAPELLELGLSVPQVTKIFLKLREMGVDVPADVYTIPYAVKMILAAKARRDAGETLVLPRNEEQKGGAAGC